MNCTKGRKIGASRKMPAVSVVIPTYNRANLLQRAIKSVRDQTLESWELIVVDDGSTDNTKYVVDELTDSRVRYASHDNNEGAASARNTGIEKSKSEYIAFLDVDDVWYEKKLEIQLDKAKNQNADLVYCNEVVKGRGKNKVRRSTISGKNVWKKLLLNDRIGSCSRVLAKRKTLIDAGMFDEGLPSQQDWDMWFRVAKIGKVYNIDEILVEKYLYKDNISNDLSKLLQGEERVFEKHKELLKKRAGVRAKRLSRLAKLKFNDDVKKGAIYACRSLKIDPFKPKLVIAMMIAAGGKEFYKTIYVLWRRIRGHKFNEYDKILHSVKTFQF